MKTSQLAALFFTCLLGLIPCAATAKPFVVSADGLEVTDSATGLIWRRCAEGMAWDAAAITCAGTASTFTHELALTRARTEAFNTGVAWRLPSVKELSSIVDRSLSNSAIDATAFPASPLDYFWSSSPNVSSPSNAWNVNFSNGAVFSGSSYYRSSPFYVRLVRAGQ
jgi:hypothetical protein